MSHLLSIVTAIWAILLFTGFFDKKKKDDRN